jgi:hypothetical protein
VLRRFPWIERSALYRGGAARPGSRALNTLILGSALVHGYRVLKRVGGTTMAVDRSFGFRHRPHKSPRKNDRHDPSLHCKLPGLPKEKEYALPERG